MFLCQPKQIWLLLNLLHIHYHHKMQLVSSSSSFACCWHGRKKFQSFVWFIVEWHDQKVYFLLFTSCVRKVSRLIFRSKQKSKSSEWFGRSSTTFALITKYFLQFTSKCLVKNHRKKQFWKRVNRVLSSQTAKLYQILTSANERRKNVA